jgi:acetyl esterase/lipase
MRKALIRTLGVLVGLAVAVYAAFQISPWPGVLIIRRGFDDGAQKASDALKKHVPAGVVSRLGERYDPADRDAFLDVHYPAELEGTDRVLPTVVWVHGGAWVSGSKDLIANYLRVLAGRGFTVVGVDYTVAPAKVYPAPIVQVNRALAHLNGNARRLHVDGSRLLLAGDSAGSQIAAQMANIVSAPEYAAAVGISPSIGRSQLVGLVLHCGAYEVKLANLDGAFGGFLRTVLWAYSGRKDFQDDVRFAMAWVVDRLTPAFPPSFISAGNADPLLPQSRVLADALTRRGVPVEVLFFPDDHHPPLSHEYQFDLDTEAGRLALDRSAAFIERCAATGR